MKLLKVSNLFKYSDLSKKKAAHPNKFHKKETISNDVLKLHQPEAKNS